MPNDQIVILIVLTATMVLFLWGRWRHDLVAMAALMICVMSGIVPGRAAFSGFGHPAVITVASVLVLGYGLRITGAVDVLARRLLPASAGIMPGILALCGLAGLLSCFMNNVGALALLMPIAIQMAGKHDLPPGKFLMPLAFGSILGGMTTLIGPPPNLIVSGFRATSGMGHFGMFDFTPVGLSVAVIGILFMGLIGWRLVPRRKQHADGGFESGAYLSEVRIVEGSRAADKRIREVEQILDEADAQIIAMVRNDVRIPAPNPSRILREGDILVVEVEPESLSSVLSDLGVKLEGDMPADAEETDEEAVKENTDKEKNQNHSRDEDRATEKTQSDEITIQELVVTPNSALAGRSASDIQLRTLYGINLLALSRKGRRSVRRLKSTPVRAGDVLLMQGAREALSGFAADYRCLPLAARDIRIPKKGLALTAVLIMVLAVGAAALGLLPAAVSFTAGVVVFVALGIVPLRSVYTAIDWPVIVLLGAMLPVADAMATTGAADLIARFLIETVARGHAVAVLTLLLVMTMFLSDLMNNAATAAVMCPIALGAAHRLGVNGDGFLMAVAVGASCAFLTPIGHQNNTLILGPGGFRFGDYWRLGLILEIIVIAVGIPMILRIWPL
ncbi:MAG TPA: SLC13 family permease [bacterium]|nr:SLC13 family permease [bacterium]